LPWSFSALLKAHIVSDVVHALYRGADQRRLRPNEVRAVGITPTPASRKHSSGAQVSDISLVTLRVRADRRGDHFEREVARGRSTNRTPRRKWPTFATGPTRAPSELPGFSARPATARASVTEDRRSARRAHLANIRATYEGDGGDLHDAQVSDLSRGGLFLQTPNPLAVGRVLSLEIQVMGERCPWSAVGRVMWTRSARDDESGPPGMGVALVELEDDVSGAIQRLVDRREPTDPGIGEFSAPAREIAPTAPRAPAPSLVIALVRRKSDTPRFSAGPSDPERPSASQHKGWAILVLLVTAAVVTGAYPLRDRAAREARSWLRTAIHHVGL